MRLTFVYGAVNEAYHGSGSCIRGLPWSMVLYVRLTMVYGAVYEDYHGIPSCI